MEGGSSYRYQDTIGVFLLCTLGVVFVIEEQFKAKAILLYSSLYAIRYLKFAFIAETAALDNHYHKVRCLTNPSTDMVLSELSRMIFS